MSPAPAPAVPVEPESAPPLDARVAVENILDSCIAIEKAGQKIEDDIAQGRIHGDLDKPFIDMLSPAITGMIDTARRVSDPELQARVASMASEEVTGLVREAEAARERGARRFADRQLLRHLGHAERRLREGRGTPDQALRMIDTVLAVSGRPDREKARLLKVISGRLKTAANPGSIAPAANIKVSALQGDGVIPVSQAEPQRRAAADEAIETETPPAPPKVPPDDSLPEALTEDLSAQTGVEGRADVRAVVPQFQPLLDRFYARSFDLTGEEVRKRALAGGLDPDHAAALHAVLTATPETRDEVARIVSENLSDRPQRRDLIIAQLDRLLEAGGGTRAERLNQLAGLFAGTLGEPDADGQQTQFRLGVIEGLHADVVGSGRAPNSETVNQIGRLILELLPVSGNILSAREAYIAYVAAYDALQRGETTEAVLKAGEGVLATFDAAPILGNLLKLRKAADNIGKLFMTSGGGRRRGKRERTPESDAPPDKEIREEHPENPGSKSANDGNDTNEPERPSERSIAPQELRKQSPNDAGRFTAEEFVSEADHLRFREIVHRGIPLGFNDLEQLREISAKLRTSIGTAGFTDSLLVIRGSSVAGRKFDKTTKHYEGPIFDSAKRSDWDLAIVDPSMFEAAERIAARSKTLLRQGRRRTVVLQPWQLRELGLGDLADQLHSLSRESGRKVTVMIYKNEDALRERGPAMRLP